MPPQPAKLSIWQRLKLLTGRPRRLYLNVLRPGYVRASLARREGECRRCGACCQMGLYCRHMTYDDNLSSCRRYAKYRTSNCRNFPIDERDLAERDLVFPDTPCGYRFRPAAGVRNNSRLRSENETGQAVLLEDGLAG